MRINVEINRQKKGRHDRDIIVTRYQPATIIQSISYCLARTIFTTLSSNVKYQPTFFMSLFCKYILYFQSHWHHLSNISRFAWKMLSFVILCCWEHGTISNMKFFVHCSVKENYYILNYTFYPDSFKYNISWTILVVGVGYIARDEVWGASLQTRNDWWRVGGLLWSPTKPTATFPSVAIVKAEKHVNNAVICQWIIIENMGLSFLDFILRTSVMCNVCVCS